MGDYVFALKKTLRKNATLDGDKVQVDMAPYAYKPSWFGRDYDLEDFGLRMWIERAGNTPPEEQAPYIIFSDKADGWPVYKNNKLGVWGDGSGHYTGVKLDDLVGKMYKIGNRFYIVPKDQQLEEFIKTNFLNLYNTPLPHTQVYVKMHEGYTATVRDIRSLKEYLAGYGKMDPKYMTTISAGDDVPGWFQAIVSQLVSDKRRELQKAEISKI